MTTTKRVLTPEEVAIELRVGRNLLYRQLKAGKIPGAFKLGYKWLIPSSQLERLLGENTEKEVK